MAVPLFAQTDDASAHCAALRDHLEASTPQQATEILQHACETTVPFLRALPNIVCVQVTKRYLIKHKEDLTTTQIQLDTVTADVRRNHGVRTYTSIKVNGKPSSVDEAGVWSTNDFSANLELLFSDKSAPRFRFKGKRSSHSSRILDFAYSIAPQNPDDLRWWPKLEIDDQMGIQVPFHGEIEINEKDFGVVRTEKIADLPAKFPYQRYIETTQYSKMILDNRTYTLPVQTETIACSKNFDCVRNVSRFGDYKVFKANHRIIVGPLN